MIGVNRLEQKPDNRMEPAFANRLIEGGNNLYSYSRKEGKLNLVANHQIKKLDVVSREKFYRHLQLEYGYTQDQINQIREQIENS